MVIAISRPRLLFQQAHVLVVVAIQAKQFPVAAIKRVVVVIMVLVVHGQLAQSFSGKFPAAASADPWEQFKRAFAVGRLAFVAVPASLGYDAVEPGMVGCSSFGHVRKLQVGLRETAARPTPGGELNAGCCQFLQAW